MMGKILVAGVGNIFQGDDGFGVEVAQRLLARGLPEAVQVVDFGIRGFDLAFALLEPWQAVILVDAISRSGEPGTLYTIEPDLESQPDTGDSVLNTHGMHPVNVLRMVRAMGGTPPAITLLACEPEDLGGEEGRMGLTPRVQQAVDAAVAMIEQWLSTGARTPAAIREVSP